MPLVWRTNECVSGSVTEGLTPPGKGRENKNSRSDATYLRPLDRTVRDRLNNAFSAVAGRSNGQTSLQSRVVAPIQAAQRGGQAFKSACKALVA
jgi:hypothetical protein